MFSAGIGVGERFSVEKDWNEISGGRKVGINLVVINEANGSIIATENFATHKSESFSNQLAVFVDKIPLGRIVCAAVSFDGCRYLKWHGVRALMMLGSDNVNPPIYGGSWALIGVKGAGRGQAIEKVLSSGISPAQITSRINLKSFRQPFIEITAESAGQNYKHGKYVIVTINDTVVDIPYVGYNRGLNVVIVNEKTGEILHSQVFDTSATTAAYSASAQFVELINRQPEGRIVVIVIKDDAIAHLSEEAIQACESIGSAFIRQVSLGGSWAIVGRKGATIGSVPESASNSLPVKSMFALTPSTENDVMCQINVQSSKYSGMGNNISVNGVIHSHTSPTTEGNLIALLKDGDCSVERSETFTTSSELVNIMKRIPPGRIVIVNLARNYRSLTDSGRAALEAIGSAKFNSLAFPHTFAIIGRKGAPKGFIPEQSYDGENRALGASIPGHPVTDSYMHLEASSSSAKIEVNGAHFLLPSEYDQGLLAVVFNETNINKYYVQAFNVNSSQGIEQFVNLTNSLPTDSTVALVTNDGGPLNQSEVLKGVLEGLGSSYISETGDGGCWAFIGQKGAGHVQGSVVEVANNDGPTEITIHIPPPTRLHDETSCAIFVESSGTANLRELQLTINGQNVNTSLLSGQGIRLAVMKQEICELEYIRTYQTYTSHTAVADLITAISAIPAGRIVIASVYGSAYPAKPYYRYRDRLERAKTAFESIGSYLFHNVHYRDAWAIIGRKGAPLGSVPEEFLHGTPSSAVAVGGTMKLSKSCENELYQLECLLSSSGEQDTLVSLCTVMLSPYIHPLRILLVVSLTFCYSDCFLQMYTNFSGHHKQEQL